MIKEFKFYIDKNLAKKVFRTATFFKTREPEDKFLKIGYSILEQFMETYDQFRVKISNRAILNVIDSEIETYNDLVDTYSKAEMYHQRDPSKLGETERRLSEQAREAFDDFQTNIYQNITSLFLGKEDLFF